MSRATSSPRATPERQSAHLENFLVFPASWESNPSDTRLQRARWMGFRDSSIDVATAISPSGWAAVSTSSQVRLYRLEGQDPTQEIRRNISLTIEMHSKDEEIRDIAMSEDLLAIATHSRLLVYKFREPGNIEDNILVDWSLDGNQSWIPRSVSVLQTGPVGLQNEVSAYVAVGGRGYHGLKLFKFSYNISWSAQSNRLILVCPRNSSFVKLVSFSSNPFNAQDQLMVSGVTSGGQIHCWSIPQGVATWRLGNGMIEPRWSLDCSSGRDASPHRDEVTSASIFISPSLKKPYLFCTVNQAQSVRTFLLPIDNTRNKTNATHWEPLPKAAAGRNVLAGAASPNGMFLVTVEDSAMKLLTLQGTYDGGLTCRDVSLSKKLSLRPAGKDISGISISIKAFFGRLEIVAVDRRGHIVFAKINARGMPAPKTPPQSIQSFEMDADSAISIVELSSGWGSRRSRRTESTRIVREHIEERLGIVPG